MLIKIALIAPGLLTIPPTGWGAVETLVYDYSVELTKQGFEVLIVNEVSQSRVLQQVRDFKPDIVHCHADNLVEALNELDCRVKAFTSHFGYLETPHRFQRYIDNTHKSVLLQDDVYIFCLSQAIAAMYLRDGVMPSRLRIAPNGVDTKLFQFSQNPTHPDRSVYLAQISARKRQYLVQQLNAAVDFVGGVSSYHDAYKAGFNPTKPNYLGEWSRTELHRQLTQYGNLVLLSEAEAHPLVCLEALSAGLGLVVSEASAANLDTNLPFITVIPEHKIHDPFYLRKEILENRSRSVEIREEIRAYSQFFNYENTVSRYISALLDILNEPRKTVLSINVRNIDLQPRINYSQHKKKRFLPGITSKIIVSYWKLKSIFRFFK